MKPINEMTDQELDTQIAIDVMGWTLGDTDIEWGLQWLTDKDGKHVVDISLWHPCKYLSQAWGALVEWCKNSGCISKMSYNTSMYPNKLRLCIWNELKPTESNLPDFFGEAENTNPARAICEACLMAARGEK